MVPATFLSSRVRPCLQQSPHHLGMALVGSSVQGSGASLSPSIHLGSVSEEQLQ